MLWLLSASSPKTLVGVAEYFRTPLKVAIAGGDKSSLSSSVIPGGGMDPLRKDGEVQRATDNDPDAVQKRRDQQEGERLRALKNRLEQIIENNPVLRQFRPQLLLDITSEGLRIQIRTRRTARCSVPAAPWSSPICASSCARSRRCSTSCPTKVSLSGHTDAANYSNGERDYSNWELSADRANASRRELISGGMNEGKVLRVLGLAATMPLDRRT